MEAHYNAVYQCPWNDTARHMRRYIEEEQRIVRQRQVWLQRPQQARYVDDLPKWMTNPVRTREQEDLGRYQVQMRAAHWPRCLGWLRASMLGDSRHSRPLLRRSARRSEKVTSLLLPSHSLRWLGSTGGSCGRLTV